MTDVRINILLHFFSSISLVSSQSFSSFLIFLLLFSYVRNTLEPINLEMGKKHDYSNFLFSHTSFVGYMNNACGSPVNLLSNWTFITETSFPHRNCASNILYAMNQNQQILLHLYCVSHKSLSVLGAKKSVCQNIHVQSFLSQQVDSIFKILVHCIDLHNYYLQKIFSDPLSLF